MARKKAKEAVKVRIMFRGGSQNHKILDWEDDLSVFLFFPEAPKDVSANAYDCVPKVAKYKRSDDIDEFGEMEAFYDFVAVEVL